MPWSWNTPGPMTVDLGGTVGSVQEAKQPGAWPNYEAEYLKARLQSGKGKYNTDGVASAGDKAQVYLDKISDDYKTEANQALKQEFVDWLQGRHELNNPDKKYDNLPGKPVRRWVYNDGVHEPSSQRDNWSPTWWGQAQLTHLPGVRDFLRKMEQERNSNDMQMNLLADHGPQDLEQAWMYFKHWVKGRPVGNETAIFKPRDGRGQRSAFGMQPPETFWANGRPLDDDGSPKGGSFTPFSGAYRPYVPPSEYESHTWNKFGAATPVTTRASAETLGLTQAKAARAQAEAAAAAARAGAAAVQEAQDRVAARETLKGEASQIAQDVTSGQNPLGLSTEVNEVTDKAAEAVVTAVNNSGTTPQTRTSYRDYEAYENTPLRTEQLDAAAAQIKAAKLSADVAEQTVEVEESEEPSQLEEMQAEADETRAKTSKLNEAAKGRARSSALLETQEEEAPGSKFSPILTSPENRAFDQKLRQEELSSIKTSARRRSFLRRLNPTDDA